MNFHVYNYELFVGDIQITEVTSSSLIQVGDIETIQLAAIFDKPTESLTIGPHVPIVPTGKKQ